MKRFHSNKYLAIASLSGFIYFGIGHFVNLPDIVEGFCIGISIVCFLISLYASNHDLSKLQIFKKNLINRFAK